MANEITIRRKGVTTMTNTKTQKDFATKRTATGTVQDLNDGQGVFRLLAPADAIIV